MASNLDMHVTHAVRRVEKYGEDPRMAVVVATSATDLSHDQREEVLDRTRDEMTPAVDEVASDD